MAGPGHPELDDDQRLASSHRLDSVRAHLLEMAGDHEAAREHYRTAARRTTSVPERRHLERQADRLADAKPDAWRGRLADRLADAEQDPQTGAVWPTTGGRRGTHGGTGAVSRTG